jgi:hypothetical protein
MNGRELIRRIIGALGDRASGTPPSSPAENVPAQATKTSTPFRFDPEGYSFGRAQRSGALTVLPLFGPDGDGKFAPPLSGLKLSKVKGYGNVELENPTGAGVAIVPLHIGYIQDRAQNHALCRSAFIGAGAKLTFTDACCVQQSQGGFLHEAQQWFFILPLPLREEALGLRGTSNYGKLWTAISRLNEEFGFAGRGHLEQIVCRERSYLTQYVSRFELLSGQTGALFFLGDRLAGIEIAPSARYFAEIWMPLVCFCYGTAAMRMERQDGKIPASMPFSAGDLAGLRRELERSRAVGDEELRRAARDIPEQSFQVTEEERYLDLRLGTAIGRDFAGQIVHDGGRLVYASLFAKRETLSR